MHKYESIKYLVLPHSKCRMIVYKLAATLTRYQNANNELIASSSNGVQ